MRNIRTMIRRELGAYFLSPIAYAIAATFLFTSGLAFGLGTFQPGSEASLRGLCSPSPWILFVLLGVIPFLTMRLVSDELRGGTIETLMTAPITETEIVLGKFFGALLFYMILLAALLLYPIILEIYGDVDFLLLVSNYLGFFLVGALFVAVGLFFSTWSKHQVIAALLSLAVLSLMTFAAHGLAQLEIFEGWMRVVLQQLSIITHFQTFVRGLINLNHVVFFVSTIGLFLFLSVKVLEMRRWQ